jgi:glycyl-tRNA synthetase beta chain
MQQHQKYVPLRDKKTGKLLPRFLFVSNISAGDPTQIIHGNERVLRARLSDAKFFYDQDRKTRLEARVPRLANVVYHNKLGTQLERVERIKKLAGATANGLKADAKAAERAAFLCKADLLTDMVGEFPELQGTMGSYYALHDGETKTVSDAIGQHYRPRFAGDALPQGPIGCAVALADKLISLAGLFAIQQQPTGDKDPFGLRRAALGVVRILVENKLALNLDTLIANAFCEFPAQLAPANLLVRDFVYERFSSYLKDRGYSTIEIDSVMSTTPQQLDLVPQKLEAVRAFLTLPEAESLAAANKRIGNILKQARTKGEFFDKTNQRDLKEPAEIALFDALATASGRAKELFQRNDYTGYLKALAVLKAPVDVFFDKVMVMVEEDSVRKNRLALLDELQKAMNHVADISKLAA